MWWSGKGDEVGGVGVMVKEELCEKDVEVRRVSGRVIAVVVVFEEDVLRLICGNALQSERSLKEKLSFLDKLKSELHIHSAGNLITSSCDVNGYVGRHIDGFDGVHGLYGIGQRNLELRIFLWFCLEIELCV